MEYTIITNSFDGNIKEEITLDIKPGDKIIVTVGNENSPMPTKKDVSLVHEQIKQMLKESQLITIPYGISFSVLKFNS